MTERIRKAKRNASEAVETAKPPQLLAIGVVQDAEAYVEGAHVLDGVEGGPIPRLFAPTYFLLCQAIELALSPADWSTCCVRPMLQKALKKAGPVLRFSEHLEGPRGEAMFRHACASQRVPLVKAGDASIV